MPDVTKTSAICGRTQEREDVWGGLADFTFRRFPTPGLVRLAWSSP